MSLSRREAETEIEEGETLAALCSWWWWGNWRQISAARSWWSPSCPLSSCPSSCWCVCVLVFSPSTGWLVDWVTPADGPVSPVHTPHFSLLTGCRALNVLFWMEKHQALLHFIFISSYQVVSSIYLFEIGYIEHWRLFPRVAANYYFLFIKLIHCWYLFLPLLIPLSPVLLPVCNCDLYLDVLYGQNVWLG